MTTLLPMIGTTCPQMLQPSCKIRHTHLPFVKNALLLVVLTSLMTFEVTGAPIPTTVDDRNTLIRGDQEVFPFGIYHVSWIGERYGMEQFQDMVRVTQNGLGVMKAPLDPTSRASDLTLLEGANKLGMGIMAELYPPSLDLLIDHLKDYPAVISWQIGDDFNVTRSANYCSPEQLKERHELAKQHDPNHVTYASGGSAPVEWHRSFKDYHGCVDMIGIQCYPVGNETDFPDAVLLESSYQLIKGRVQELNGSKIVPIANLQSFAWKENGKLPTPFESRNLLYGALAAGVKGVLYYTFYDNTRVDGEVTLDRQAPELWREIGRQAEEIRQLESFLLHGIREEIATGHEKVHFFIWRKGEDRIFLIINTDRKQSYDLWTEIPAAPGTQANPLFANRPSGMQIVHGYFQGAIGPEEVHVYLIAPKLD